MLKPPACVPYLFRIGIKLSEGLFVSYYLHNFCSKFRGDDGGYIEYFLKCVH